MQQLNYRNLTNGLNCPHTSPTDRVLRIQSTWCEQKHWDEVLMTASPDLLYNLAIGNCCVVHDVSERDRETRACWQGLSWLRYACTLAWTGEERQEHSRNGCNVTAYWREQYHRLGTHERNYLRYFRKFHAGGPVDLVSCWGLS